MPWMRPARAGTRSPRGWVTRGGMVLNKSAQRGGMVLKNCPGRGPMILKIDTPRRILSATPSAGCGRGTGASETIWSPLLVIVGRSALLGPRHAAAAGGVDGFPRNKYRSVQFERARAS